VPLRGAPFGVTPHPLTESHRALQRPGRSRTVPRPQRRARSPRASFSERRSRAREALVFLVEWVVVAVRADRRATAPEDTGQLRRERGLLARRAGAVAWVPPPPK